jgi:hypothetical protein
MPTTIDREEWKKLAEVSSRLPHYERIAKANPRHIKLRERINIVNRVVVAVPVSRKSFVLYLAHEISQLIEFLTRIGCNDEFLHQEVWIEEKDGCSLGLKPTIVVKRGKYGEEKLLVKKMTYCAGRCPQKGHKCITRHIPSDVGLIPNCSCQP